METQQPESARSIRDLASCLVNSQLFLDNTHSCFCKNEKKKKMALSWVQYIKVFVQVGAWAWAVFLNFRLFADYQADFLWNQQQTDPVEKTLGVTLVTYYSFRSQKKCFRYCLLFACSVVVFYFGQTDGRVTYRSPCMAYPHIVLGTEEGLRKSVLIKMMG